MRQRGTSDCNPWDEDLHLPHWISSNERNQLIFRIDRWTEDLLALGADLSGLAEALAKPLRCFWVSQGDGECHIDANAARYTPLILISASVPNMRSRQRLCLDAEDVAALGLAAGDASLTSDSSMCDVDVMFDYIPGAGDDEESWAQGLTPPVMWLHWRNLLQAGPEGIGSLAKQLVKRHKSSNGTTSGGSDAEETWSEVRWVGTTGLGLCIASRAAGLSALDPPCAVVHIGGTHVEGFGPDEHVEVVLQDSLTNEGYADIGPSVLLGNNYEGIDPGVGPHRYLALPGAASSSDKHALLRHLPAAVAFASGSFVAGRRVVIVGDHTKMDVSAAVLLAVLLACFNLKEPDGGGPQLLEWCRPCCLDPVSLVLEPVAQPFSRLVVRQYLAASLAVWCPQVVLSKSLLKQVFNAFYPGRMTKHGSTTIAQTVADDVDN